MTHWVMGTPLAGELSPVGHTASLTHSAPDTHHLLEAGSWKLLEACLLGNQKNFSGCIVPRGGPPGGQGRPAVLDKKSGLRK